MMPMKAGVTADGVALMKIDPRMTHGAGSQMAVMSQIMFRDDPCFLSFTFFRCEGNDISCLCQHGLPECCSSASGERW